MMNRKLVKILAMVLVMVCAAMMMASCVAGGTKADQKGNEEVIERLVPDRDETIVVPDDGPVVYEDE